MPQEVERKFLVSELPSLENITPIKYERYFLEISDFREVRIQKKWEYYGYEEKITINNLTAEKITKEISQEKFEDLKIWAIRSIIRESYYISNNPEISLKKYYWDFEWLVRVEVEFKNDEEARSFKIPHWFWEEITDSPLWRDSKLVQLARKDFISLISS